MKTLIYVDPKDLYIIVIIIDEKYVTPLTKMSSSKGTDI